LDFNSNVVDYSTYNDAVVKNMYNGFNISDAHIYKDIYLLYDNWYCVITVYPSFYRDYLHNIVKAISKKYEPDMWPLKWENHISQHEHSVRGGKCIRATPPYIKLEACEYNLRGYIKFDVIIRAYNSNRSCYSHCGKINITLNPYDYLLPKK